MMLSSGWRRRSVWVGAACLAVAASGAGVQAAEEETKPPLAPGAVVTYKDASGREWCATIETLSDGPGREPWAWISFNTDRRRTGRAPLSELRLGCGS